LHDKNFFVGPTHSGSPSVLHTNILVNIVLYHNDINIRDERTKVLFGSDDDEAV